MGSKTTQAFFIIQDYKQDMKMEKYIRVDSTEKYLTIYIISPEMTYAKISKMASSAGCQITVFMDKEYFVVEGEPIAFYRFGELMGEFLLKLKNTKNGLDTESK